jgi:hypothetical protein
MRSSFLIFAGLCAAAAYAAPSHDDRAASASALLVGKFDNRQQVDKAAQNGDAPPHVVVTVEAVPVKNWSMWHVHLETDPQTSYDQTWIVETRIEHDGSIALIPYYELRQETPPTVAEFDQSKWLSLEACALRGSFRQAHVDGLSEGEPCVAASMSVGARRALLPVGIVREGDWLHLDFNLRGARTRIDARRE